MTEDAEQTANAPISPETKLTPALRAILERVERHSGSLLELAVVASGCRAPGQLAKLIRAGYIERCDHPTVKNGKYPADALSITERGREALRVNRSKAR